MSKINFKDASNENTINQPQQSFDSRLPRERNRVPVYFNRNTHAKTYPQSLPQSQKMHP
jgi:hypothetical protein